MQPRRLTNIASERLSIIRRELRELKAATPAKGVADSAASDKWEQVDHLLAQVAEDHRSALERLARLSTLQRNFDSRLLAIENSLVFRSLRAAGGGFSALKNRSADLLSRLPFRAALRRALLPGGDTAYRLWSQREETRLVSRYRDAAIEGPAISVLMPVHNPDKEWLAAAIQSVRRQFYANWQLCICDDSSTEDWVLDYLKEQARSDHRITLCPPPHPSGISRTLNSAAAEASGHYVTVLHPDDTIPPYALSAVVEAIHASEASVVYADEDRLDKTGCRVEPAFKPGWSPNLLLSCMYAGRPLVVARECGEKVGWFRPECDGSEDYDLLLRVTDGADAVNVQHVPHVLYHRRIHPRLKSKEVSSYAHRAGRIALQDAIDRRGWSATVDDGAMPARYRVRARLAEPPLVSIVICSRNAALLRRCLAAIERSTDYRPFEVIVVHHLTGNDRTLSAMIERSRCIRVPYNAPYNSSLMNNLGRAAARGDVLLFLNDDIEPLHADWLRLVVEDCVRPGVGAVGALLKYPSGAIQHAGIAVGISDACGHVGRGRYASSYWPWLTSTRDVSAVTGACLAIRSTVFDEIGGFRDAFAMNYGDVDLCLRVREKGLAVVFEPHSRLLHSECGTRTGGTHYSEREAWHLAWHVDDSFEDSFYSPNLAKSEDIRLRLND